MPFRERRTRAERHGGRSLQKFGNGSQPEAQARDHPCWRCGLVFSAQSFFCGGVYGSGVPGGMGGSRLRLSLKSSAIFIVGLYTQVLMAATLVIGGTRDRAFSTELFRATAAGIPGARLVLYEGRGHLGTMLDPRFGRDVAAFLNNES